jgi:hypothetical protein
VDAIAEHAHAGAELMAFESDHWVGSRGRRAGAGLQ